MSEDCCGSQQSARAGGRTVPHGAPVPDLIREPASSSDEGGVRRPAGRVPCSAPEHPGSGDIEAERDAVWWRDRNVLLPLASGVLLGTGWLLELVSLSVPALVMQSGSLLVGASTFVPGAVRRLLSRRLGVGLLMTVAAAGSVLLGHVAEPGSADEVGFVGGS